VSTVVCYGDSNTWGYEAGTERHRFDRSVRWPGVLQQQLGDGVHVVEEGLNSRTTMFDDPEQPFRNGLATLPMILETHAPIDVLVVLLGTNDLFLPQRTDARGAARGTAAIAEAALTSGAGPDGAPPRVLVLIPPPFARLRPDWALDSPHGPEESTRFAEAYRVALGDLDCDVLDLATIARHTDIDGIHFEPDQHRAIGLAVADAVRPMLALGP
jgi:lysophospholipase L1-like esterase